MAEAKGMGQLLKACRGTSDVEEYERKDRKNEKGPWKSTSPEWVTLSPEGSRASSKAGAFLL